MHDVLHRHACLHACVKLSYVARKTFCVDDYEHLDTIWAHDAKDKVGTSGSSGGSSMLIIYLGLQVFPLISDMLAWVAASPSSKDNRGGKQL